MTPKTATTLALEQAAKDYIDRGEYQNAKNVLQAMLDTEWNKQIGLKVEDFSPVAWPDASTPWPELDTAKHLERTLSWMEKQKERDLWIEWKGGYFAYGDEVVIPKGNVQIRRRDGTEGEADASCFHWDHHGWNSDVIAWRFR